MIKKLFKSIIKSNTLPFVVVEGDQLPTFHFFIYYFNLLALLQFAKIKEFAGQPNLLSTATPPPLPQKYSCVRLLLATSSQTKYNNLIHKSSKIQKSYHSKQHTFYQFEKTIMRKIIRNNFLVGTANLWFPIWLCKNSDPQFSFLAARLVGLLLRELIIWKICLPIPHTSPSSKFWHIVVDPFINFKLLPPPLT